jgi:hypothetical protein
MATCQFCGAQVDQLMPAAAESQRAGSAVEGPAPDRSALAAPLSQPVEPPSASPSTLPADVAGRSKPSRIASSGVLRKLILFYLAAPVGVLAVVFISVRFVSLFQSSKPEGDSSGISTSQQSETGSPPRAANSGGLGIEVYPGAQTVSGEDQAATSDGSVVSATYVSSDTMNKVIDFYKVRMVGYASIYADGPGVVVSITRSPTDSIRVAISPAQSGGTTRIFISHTTSSK